VEVEVDCGLWIVEVKWKRKRKLKGSRGVGYDAHAGLAWRSWKLAAGSKREGIPEDGKYRFKWK
jgi:hypothetical protein